jgi:microcystin-dependent protein
MAFWKWSRTASSNATADSTINWAEGMAPSAVNDSARAMMARIAEWRDDVSGTITTAGISTAYTLASNQGFDNFADMNGAMVAFVPHTTNGATVTLNVDGLGNRPLRFGPGLELQSGVLIQGTPYVVSYNNSDGAFYLQGLTANPYGIPLGGLMPYLGPTAPNSAFALPYGQAISQTTYATLYAVIGPNAFAPDSGGNFFLPDLRGRAVFGVDNMGGSAAGRVTAAGGNYDATIRGNAGGGQNQTLTQAQLPAFAPTFTGTQQTWSLDQASIMQQGGGVNFSAGPSLNFATLRPTVTITPSGTISNLGSGNSHPIMPPSVALPFIVRII